MQNGRNSKQRSKLLEDSFSMEKYVSTDDVEIQNWTKCVQNDSKLAILKHLESF